MGTSAPELLVKNTDIAIIGGGLAGSTAAAMLGRAGVAAILVDPHRDYPPDFRVEKLSGDEQIARFRKTGIADAVLRKAAHANENWIARFGVLLDKAPRDQIGLLYDELVNAVRTEIPDQVEKIFAKAVSISASADRSTRPNIIAGADSALQPEKGCARSGQRAIARLAYGCRPRSD